MKKLDLNGKTFGRLTVVQEAPTVNGQANWQCHCICGNVVTVYAGNLVKGFTRSCGCLRSDVTKARVTTHRMTATPLHRKWLAMIGRCTLPANPAYHNYGGRGITVHEGWRHDFQSFHDYVISLEHYGKAGYSLDRIDNDGNYEPGNLRWATRSEQNSNQRRARMITYRGETKSLTEWAQEAGLDVRIIHKRLKKGWPVEKALTQAKRAY